MFILTLFPAVLKGSGLDFYHHNRERREFQINFQVLIRCFFFFCQSHFETKIPIIFWNVWIRFFAHLHGMRARKWSGIERLYLHEGIYVEYQILTTGFSAYSMNCSCVWKYLRPYPGHVRLSGSWIQEFLTLIISLHFQFQKDLATKDR